MKTLEMKQLDEKEEEIADAALDMALADRKDMGISDSSIILTREFNMPHGITLINSKNMVSISA